MNNSKRLGPHLKIVISKEKAEIYTEYLQFIMEFVCVIAIGTFFYRSWNF